MADHNFTKEPSDPSNSDNRSQLSSITVDKPANDVYNWRKYGQKEVKGSEYPQSYYRCSHPNCLAKKKVEHSVEGLVTNIIYRGQHNHQPPQAERGKDTAHGTSNEYEQGLEGQTGNFKDQESTQATYEQSGLSDCEEVDDDATRMDERHEDEPEGKRRNIEFGTLDPVSSHRKVREPRITFKTISEVDLIDDGFRWRKYGQKEVNRSPFPRSYYKCTYRGCPARKHVERDASDPKVVMTTYTGKHNHDRPAARNSLAATTHVDTDERLETSSSLTPPSTLVSSSRLSNHDVFLSFRGMDVDKTFVDHIYSTLLQKGIHTYKEDVTFHGGEFITPSHLKVIRESHVVVIIFSKNYAESSWCLSELAYVMETKDQIGQIVMPVFYGVEAVDVQYQQGEFGKSFTTHKSTLKVAQSWRKALWDATQLSSWTENDVMNGMKFMKTIVDTISSRLLPSMPSDNSCQIGIKSRIQDLKAQLEVAIGGVHMVGVTGIWGSGKSALASSIYDEIRHEFDGCCLVKNVGAQSRLHGLKKLQEKILSKALKLRKVVLGSIEEGISMMTNRLSCISVLIVLDDVDHLDQLKMLAGSQDWFGEGSRIIIITRNIDLLKAHNINMIYNVRLLNEEEAIELFSMHAFGARSPVEGYEKLTLDMVSKFGGHPSSLVSLGSFLRDKYMSAWISTSTKLEDIPDDETTKLFKTSDDGVQNNIYSWLRVEDETMEEFKIGDIRVQDDLFSWFGVEEVGIETSPLLG